ncbi:MAG: DUF1957 domain-containing protein [Deltaproteobacteria bacterium]|nr:DUF1957 domain-containing protein [Deltaproteobacteria bacterium]
MSNKKFYGSYLLGLHFHIPWVLNKNEMEEEWLFEATAETYIPILNVFNRLANEGVSPQVTVDISPVLCEQLAHPDFKRKFEEYCWNKITEAQKDQAEFQHKDGHLNYLASQWEKFYQETLDHFTKRYGYDLLQGFKTLQDDGHIEIMTCGATHGYFPAMAEDTSIQAQTALARANYRKYFGRDPRGMWLPECGYRPSYWWRPPTPSRSGEWPYRRKGVEEFLSESGIRYFMVDDHQLRNAYPYDLDKNPLYGYIAGGAQAPGGDVSVLARDIGLSLQVWRAEVGYPGDGAYLEFHKKHSLGKHRYWKVTDKKADLGWKQRYYPDDAMLGPHAKVKEHAGHYKYLIATSLKNHFEVSGHQAMVMTTFDAELYGHWWFEGPMFIYYVLRWISQDPNIKPETVSSFLDRMPPVNRVYLPESSWGNNFDNSTWINPEVHWVLDREYAAEREMQYLVKEIGGLASVNQEVDRVLKQAARELLLLQASDWKFMITNWSARDLAEKRVVEHHSDFFRLAAAAWCLHQGKELSQEDREFIDSCCTRDNLFPEIDLSWYEGLRYPAVC